MSVICKVGKRTLSCLFLGFLSCLGFLHCQLLIDNLIWLSISGYRSSIDIATSAGGESYPPLKCNLTQAWRSVYRRSTRPLPEAMKISHKSPYKPEVPWYKNPTNQRPDEFVSRPRPPKRKNRRNRPNSACFISSLQQRYRQCIRRLRDIRIFQN
jgi:hypothetical protein